MLVKKVIEEIHKRGVAGARETMPKMCMTLASHMLNLRHKGIEVNQVLDQDSGEYRLKGVSKPGWAPIAGNAEATDMRAHLMLIGKPASGKGLFRDQLFDPTVGLAPHIAPVKSLSKVTDAAMVGGKEPVYGGGTRWMPGLLSSKSDHILYTEEFSRVNAEAKRNFNVGMMDTLLEALERGRVGVDQIGVEAEVRTNVTAYLCTQPQRFENVSGIDRRCIFHNLPDPEYNPIMHMEAMHKYQKWSTFSVDYDNIARIRGLFTERFSRLGDIRSFCIGDGLAEYIRYDSGAPSSMFPILTKACMAYWFLEAKEVEPDMVVPNEIGLQLFVHDAASLKARANLNAAAIALVMNNALGLTELKKRLREERHAPSLPAAGELIEAIAKACARDGVRYVEIGMGGRPFRVLTGLEIKDVLERHPGGKLCGEVRWDGKEIERDAAGGGLDA